MYNAIRYDPYHMLSKTESIPVYGCMTDTISSKKLAQQLAIFQNLMTLIVRFDHLEFLYSECRGNDDDIYVWHVVGGYAIIGL